MAGEARSVLFDLDGTLVATPDAIAEQLVEAVHDVIGIRPGRDAARKLVGRPLEELCRELLVTVQGLPDLAATVATAYQERYRNVIVPAARELLYPGVLEGLEILRERGVLLAIVTTKVQRSAEQLLESAGIASHFTSVVGADRVPRPKPDPAGVLLALHDMRVDGTERSAMVGDTHADIVAARNAGVAAVGVTYGVGHRRELVSAGAKLVAEDFPTVVRYLSAGDHGEESR